MKPGRIRRQMGGHVEKEVALRNIDIAIYALYLLGGTERKIDTEDVTLKCFELAPERFSWRKRPGLPGGIATLYALQDARRKRNSNLVRGGVKGGWMLTPAGIDQVRKLLPVLENLASGEMRGTLKPREGVQRFFHQLETHTAYEKFVRRGSCDKVKRYEFTDFLNCTVDSGAEILRDRLEAVRALAYDARREDILRFLQACEERFADILAPK